MRRPGHGREMEHEALEQQALVGVELERPTGLGARLERVGGGGGTEHEHIAIGVERRCAGRQRIAVHRFERGDALVQGFGPGSTVLSRKCFAM